MVMIEILIIMPLLDKLFADTVILLVGNVCVPHSEESSTACGQLLVGSVINFDLINLPLDARIYK